MQPEKEVHSGEIDTSAKSLRTYQGDVEEAVSKNHYSSSAILIAEEKRRNETEVKLQSPTNSKIKNKFFFIAGSIMLLLGIITVSSIYYVKSANQVVIQQKTKAMISFSEEKVVPAGSLNRDSLLANIAESEKTFQLPLNSILYVNIVDSSNLPINVEKMLSLVAPRIPQALVRSFGSEYMFGIYSYDTNKPFLILTTRDFANSYSGMLKWEKDMVSDLGALFSISQNAGSTTAEFKDEALQNKDLRILQAEDGKTVLLYSFIDKNTLVIASSENIFTAIVGKYNVSKQIR